MQKIINQIYNDYSGIIAQFILLNQAKTIVEIGVNEGDTTLALCEAARFTGGTVHGIDMWATHGVFNQFKQSGDYSLVKNRLDLAGLTNYTLTVKNTYDKDFPDTLKELTGGNIDLAFIDGDHSYIGCLNDLQAVYPLLSSTGVVVFHDTQRIDGCRELIYDLRTKFYDGTYDIFDLHGGYNQRMMGISFLIKRQFPILEIPINQLCGSPSSAKDIECNERTWYENELNTYKNNVKMSDIDIHSITLHPIDEYRPKRTYML